MQRKSYVTLRVTTSVVFQYPPSQQAAVATESGKLYDNGAHRYYRDVWNLFHLLGLALLLVAFVLRATGSGGIWGPSLYGMSAPLLFSRIIFFAQIAPIKGPLIQVRIISCYRYTRLLWVCSCLMMGLIDHTILRRPCM